MKIFTYILLIYLFLTANCMADFSDGIEAGIKSNELKLERERIELEKQQLELERQRILLDLCKSAWENDPDKMIECADDVMKNETSSE